MAYLLYFYGGAERVLWDISNGLIERGHKIVLFAPNESQVPTNGFLFKTGPASNTVNVDWVQLEKAMWEKCDRYFDDFDIVMGSDWFGFEYLSKIRNPSLMVCHLHHGGLNPDWWNKSKPPFKTNMIAISRWMKGVYNSQGYPSEVAYNPVNLDEYRFQKDKGDRLLFVGRLDNFKQPDVAIGVAKKLSVGLDIVGGSFVQDINYLNDIKSQCDGAQIKLYLDATQEKKIELYQNAKAVLFPSRMGEPFGLIVPEGNSCGSFVIGLRDGAIPETINEGISGFVVGNQTQQINDKQSDIDAMVEAVKRLDSIKIDPMKCRENAERFSIQRCAERYEKLYEDILNGISW